MANNYKKHEPGDDIYAILHHSGMLSDRLDRFEEVSSRMWQLEWSLMKRAAADAAVCASPSAVPAGE